MQLLLSSQAELLLVPLQERWPMTGDPPKGWRSSCVSAALAPTLMGPRVYRPDLIISKDYGIEVLLMERSMRELASTVTRKGQVTIPVEIRRLLNVAPYDRVAFVVEDDRVQLRRTGSVAQRTAGALGNDIPARSPEAERAAAEQAIAEEAEPPIGT
jgi:antitoxin PrlF